MAEISYLDFDLMIERSGEKSYRARVLSSPAGQASAEITLPFSDLELENFLLKIGHTRRGVRRLESPEMEAAKVFGGKLFKAVFEDELMDSLNSSLEEARKQQQGLRIRLRLKDSPELVNLPWEYLYNPSLNRFLSLSVNTPLIRYLELPERIIPKAVKPPLRVLAVISSPTDYPGLDVEREWTNLNAALADLIQRGALVLDRLETASPTELQYSLRRNEYHIFHFIGHGGFNEQAQDGILLFADENQRGFPLSGQYLGTLLHDEDTLRLVVLNACEGGRSGITDPFAGVAQSLVQQGLPAVIAMQFEVTDEAAITFAREFYTAIADGYPVDASLAEARKAIFSLGNDTEWGTPVLYMRAPDGRIFDFLQPSPSEVAPVEVTPVEVVKPQLTTEAVHQAPTARPATIPAILPTPAKKKPSNRVLVGIAASLVVITAICISGISLGQRLLNGLTVSKSPTLAVNTTVQGQPVNMSSSTEATQPDNTPESPAAFAPATLTPTPTPPAAFNLTNNREGKYAQISLFFDTQGLLHLVYRSILPRGGDYYHQQWIGGGDFTPAEVLTTGFKALWGDLVQALHPQGYVCVLWAGVSENEGEAYFRRCQNSLGGSFSAAEVWKFDRSTSFSPLFLPDGSLQAVLARVGSLTFEDQVISSDKATNVANPHLVRDPAGNYHVVWFRPGDPYSLEYSHSQDAGTSWSPAVRLTTDATAPDARFDFEADQQGNLHLVWPGFHGGAYYLRWSPTQGWTEPVKISPYGCGLELAVNTSGLARAAQSCWNGTYFLEQLPNGDWLPPYQVAGTGNGLELDIAVDKNDQAYIVWAAENDIFFTSFR